MRAHSRFADLPSRLFNKAEYLLGIEIAGKHTVDFWLFLKCNRKNEVFDIAFNINPHLHINKKHLDIRGIWGIDYSHFYKSVQLMARHKKRFNWHRLISKFYSLGDVAAAIEDVEALKVFKAVIAPGG